MPKALRYFTITAEGRSAFNAHVAALQAVVAQAQGNPEAQAQTA